MIISKITEKITEERIEKRIPNSAENLPIKNALSQVLIKKVPEQGQRYTLPRPLSSLVTSAGLPADKLSASIISFAKFFSLPIKPALMADIRRQALYAPDGETQKNLAELLKDSTASKTAEKNAALREMLQNRLGFASAAAESKSVELNQKSLELYALSVNPDSEKKQDGKHDKKDKKNDKDIVDVLNAISSSAIKEAALKSAQNNPLLEILNSLPDKNGWQWIVLPFSICNGEKEFKISLRILLVLKEQTAVKYFALDILETGILENAGKEKRYLFIINNFINEHSTDSTGKLTVYLDDKNPRKFCAELSKFLGISESDIIVKKRYEAFPHEDNVDAEILTSI